MTYKAVAWVLIGIAVIALAVNTIGIYDNRGDGQGRFYLSMLTSACIIAAVLINWRKKRRPR
jgi:hypothetical protein